MTTAAVIVFMAFGALVVLALFGTFCFVEWLDYKERLRRQ